MKAFLDDFKTAKKVFTMAREARRQGAVLQTLDTISLPVCDFGASWGWTMEATILQGDAGEAARNVFNNLAPELRRALTTTPREYGGWIDRARFWQEQLKDAMPARDYHSALERLCRHFRRCIVSHKEVEQA